MKEITKKRWGRFGWFCMSFVPMVGYTLLTTGVSVVFAVVVSIGAIMNGVTNFGSIMAEVLDYNMAIGAVSALLGLVGFGLWYYFGCKRKRLRIPEGAFQAKKVAALILTAFGMQFVVGYLMMGIQAAAPELMEAYIELMDMAGITELSVTVILYGVILGPIVEELIFRGVTFFYAKRATKRFWLANVIQALAFGIMHMNVVQGIYAFFIGLLLGWIYEKFHSLYASILVHIVFNFAGVCVMDVLDRMVGDSLLLEILWNLVGVAAFVAGIILLLGKRNREEA